MAPKKKAEKMTLGNFLSDQTYGSWAEEMDDMPLPSSNQSEQRPGYGSTRREYGSRPGFGSDREFGDRPFQQREQLPLPTKPPFTAHLGNLSFDVTQADIEDFFSGCQVTNVRIVEDRQDRKPKGFGYVEFETLDGLKKALELSGAQLQGRSIRISVADPPKERQEARELNDWTRKGPLSDIAPRRPSERGYRSVDAGSDTGSDRGGSRRGFDQNESKVRDLGTWERKGPLAPISPAAAPATTAGGPPAAPPGDGRGSIRRNDRSFERHASPSWGEGRSNDGSRPPRERPPPAERQPTAAELDNQWRARMKPDASTKSSTPTPDPSLPSSPVATSAVPATRPKLNLQKRTVSDAPQADQAAAASATDSKASPFGAARPIDTAAREREIEEKMLAIRQKKEEEDRERKAKLEAEKAAEKAKTDATGTAGNTSATSAAGTASSAASSNVVPTGPRENGRSSGSISRNRGADSSSKENGSSTPVTPGSNFEILRRMTEQENEEGEGEGDAETEDDGRNAPSNGQVIDDKEIKPQEVVKDATASEQPETTAETLEGDGWATVTKSSKKGRGGGGQASRAIAS